MIALTFDDGYIEHVYVARLLAKLGIRATFFLITHRKELEGKSLLTQNEEAIAEIVELGHEIGSHTCTHRVLTELSTVELVEELRNSRKFLEDVTGKEVLGLAYPYGIYNIRVIREALEYYYYARATDILPLSDPLNIRIKSKYVIGSIGLKNLHKLIVCLLDKAKKACAKPTIFIHRVNAAKLSMLLLKLRLLKMQGVEFLTLKELVEVIERGKPLPLDIALKIYKS